MSKTVKDGEFYVRNRKKQEKNLKKDLDGIEGFDVISRLTQKKNPSNFDIPQGADPGQMVMCETDKIRYVKLNQSGNFLTIQQVEVYDENGTNVALVRDNSNYSNNYKLTKGGCRKNTNYGPSTGKPDPSDMGQITTGECEEKCNSNYGMSNGEVCSAWQITTEKSTTGLNPNCWIFKDPSVTGNGDDNTMCRVRERLPETPIATMSSYFYETNPYMALDGNVSATEAWPNSACSSSSAGGWWEVDLGKLVNVKKIVIYNRPDCCQDRLNGTMVSLIDRNQNTAWSTTLNSNRRQEFNINLTKKSCGGPVIEKNLEDFQELKELQTHYNRELHAYNQAVEDRLDNSRKYLSASNKSNNEFANKWISDDKTGQTGYVTERGTYKWLPNPTIGNSIQGKNGCPNGWSSSSTKTTPDEGQQFSIGQAPMGEIVKTNGVELVKGTNMIENQSCEHAGENVFVTEPNTTTNLRFSQCSTNVPQGHEPDLGDNATYEQCRRRAADKGSNSFALGPNSGNNTTKCFVGSGMGGSGVVKTSLCSVAGNSAGNRMGRKVSGKFGVTGGNHWWNETFGWIPGYTAYAIYNTDNASNANLNQTFHITDNLEAKRIPDNMAKKGVVNAPSEFQVINNFDSAGYDITNGSSNNIEEIKQKCIETPGCAGFVYRPSTGQYWLKNANMWPKGNRRIYQGVNLYIRMPAVSLENSCSSTITPLSQNEFHYNMGPTMNSSTTCALGTISSRDLQNVNLQYKNLNAILEKMHSRIVQLGGEDVELNNRLLGQYSLLKNRLQKYEQVYSSIEKTSKLTKHDAALEEDATLNMLSNDKQFLLWSIAAMGITATALKFMK
jgi:hypothetical protein